MSGIFIFFFYLADNYDIIFDVAFDSTYFFGTVFFVHKIIKHSNCIDGVLLDIYYGMGLGSWIV